MGAVPLCDCKKENDESELLVIPSIGTEEYKNAIKKAINSNRNSLIKKNSLNNDDTNDNNNINIDLYLNANKENFTNLDFSKKESLNTAIKQNSNNKTDNIILKNSSSNNNNYSNNNLHSFQIDLKKNKNESKYIKEKSINSKLNNEKNDINDEEIINESDDNANNNNILNDDNDNDNDNEEDNIEMNLYEDNLQFSNFNNKEDLKNNDKDDINNKKNDDEINNNVDMNNLDAKINNIQNHIRNIINYNLNNNIDNLNNNVNNKECIREISILKSENDFVNTSHLLSNMNKSESIINNNNTLIEGNINYDEKETIKDNINITSPKYKKLTTFSNNNTNSDLLLTSTHNDCQMIGPKYIITSTNPNLNSNNNNVANSNSSEVLLNVNTISNKESCSKVLVKGLFNKDANIEPFLTPISQTNESNFNNNNNDNSERSNRNINNKLTNKSENTVVNNDEKAYEKNNKFNSNKDNNNLIYRYKDDNKLNNNNNKGKINVDIINNMITNIKDVTYNIDKLENKLKLSKNNSISNSTNQNINNNKENKENLSTNNNNKEVSPMNTEIIDSKKTLFSIVEKDKILKNSMNNAPKNHLVKSNFTNELINSLKYENSNISDEEDDDDDEESNHHDIKQKFNNLFIEKSNENGLINSDNSNLNVMINNYQNNLIKLPINIKFFIKKRNKKSCDKISFFSLQNDCSFNNNELLLNNKNNKDKFIYCSNRDIKCIKSNNEIIDLSDYIRKLYKENNNINGKTNNNNSVSNNKENKNKTVLNSKNIYHKKFASKENFKKIKKRNNNKITNINISTSKRDIHILSLTSNDKSDSRNILLLNKNNNKLSKSNDKFNYTSKNNKINFSKNNKDISKKENKSFKTKKIDNNNKDDALKFYIKKQNQNNKNNYNEYIINSEENNNNNNKDNIRINKNINILSNKDIKIDQNQDKDELNNEIIVNNIDSFSYRESNSINEKNNNKKLENIINENTRNKKYLDNNKLITNSSNCQQHTKDFDTETQLPVHELVLTLAPKSNNNSKDSSLRKENINSINNDNNDNNLKKDMQITKVDMAYFNINNKIKIDNHNNLNIQYKEYKNIKDFQIDSFNLEIKSNNLYNTHNANIKNNFNIYKNTPKSNAKSKSKTKINVNNNNFSNYITNLSERKMKKISKISKINKTEIPKLPTNIIPECKVTSNNYRSNKLSISNANSLLNNISNSYYSSRANLKNKNIKNVKIYNPSSNNIITSMSNQNLNTNISTPPNNNINIYNIFSNRINVKCTDKSPINDNKKMQLSQIKSEKKLKNASSKINQINKCKNNENYVPKFKGYTLKSSSITKLRPKVSYSYHNKQNYNDILYYSDLEKYIENDYDIKTNNGLLYSQKFCALRINQFEYYNTKEQFILLQKPCCFIPIANIISVQIIQINIEGYCNKTYNNIPCNNKKYFKIIYTQKLKNNLSVNNIYNNININSSTICNKNNKLNKEEYCKMEIIFCSQNEDIVLNWFNHLTILVKQYKLNDL